MGGVESVPKKQEFFTEHRGLTKGKKYAYRVIAFVKAGDKVYYSPYSKTVKIKIK
ncbi:MAG: hypothetical protein IIZ43_01875 [Eubacterium sp.]|nr:hypothetical protein [Eubacterium sp.]